MRRLFTLWLIERMKRQRIFEGSELSGLNLLLWRLIIFRSIPRLAMSKVKGAGDLVVRYE